MLSFSDRRLQWWRLQKVLASLIGSSQTCKPNKSYLSTMQKLVKFADDLDAPPLNQVIFEWFLRHFPPSHFKVFQAYRSTVILLAQPQGTVVQLGGFVWHGAQNPEAIFFLSSTNFATKTGSDKLGMFFVDIRTVLYIVGWPKDHLPLGWGLPKHQPE